MRKLFTVLLIAIVGLGHAQIINQKKVAKVKSSKLIVGLTGNADFDADMKAAVEEFWKFSSISEYLPMDEAKKKAKTDPNSLVLVFRHVRSSSCSHQAAGSNIRYKIVTSGYQVAITEGGGLKNFVATFVPTFGGETTREILYFAIALMNNTLETMEKQNLKNNIKMYSIFNSRAGKLKNKTLYIPDGWLAEKLSPNELAEIYPARIKVTSYEEWRDAIINKKEGIAYLIIVPTPLGDSYVHIHHLMDAETGACIGTAKPKAPLNVNGINVSKANTGFLNKKMASKYADLLK